MAGGDNPRKRQVLVVEDEAAIRELLRLHLLRGVLPPGFVGLVGRNVASGKNTAESDATHGTTFNAETAELAKQSRLFSAGGSASSALIVVARHRKGKGA